jgi:Flp pilus assembly protein TadD
MRVEARDFGRIRREAMALISAGHFRRAAPLLRDYLDEEPADHRAWTSLSECCDRMGDEQGVFEALRAASGALEREGLLAQAVAQWARMARLKPRDPWPEMKLAELRLALGRKADALLHYGRAEALYAAEGRQREALLAKKRRDAVASRPLEPGTTASPGLGKADDGPSPPGNGHP